LPGEAASGHWLYAYLRCDPATRQSFLVVANLHRFVPMNGVRAIMSDEIINTLESDSPARRLRLVDRLAETEGAPLRSSLAEARAPGILIPNLQPLTACYFEINLEVGKRH
jgi:hypothetical protein